MSVSKDYDDPTSILGRRFANVDHAPAFAIVSTALGGMLTKTVDAGRRAGCVGGRRLRRGPASSSSGVLDAWRAINAQDLPRVNAELAKRGIAAAADRDERVDDRLRCRRPADDGLAGAGGAGSRLRD